MPDNSMHPDDYIRLDVVCDLVFVAALSHVLSGNKYCPSEIPGSARGPPRYSYLRRYDNVVVSPRSLKTLCHGNDDTPVVN